MSLKPEYKEAILRALDHFTLDIQIKGDYYLDKKLEVARNAISEIKSDTKIDMDWLYSHNRILLEAIPPYRSFLKRRVVEAIPGDEDVELWKKENLLLVRIESKLNEFVESVMNSNHV